MRAPLAVLILLCCSCRIDLPNKPRQERATNVVWIQQYGVGAIAPPVVMWIEPAQLDCSDGRGWAVLESVNPAGCVSGLFYRETNQAFVAWPKGVKFISDTSFAHELCHAWNWDTLGLMDAPDHTGPCFLPGGYVQIANEALARVGL